MHGRRTGEPAKPHQLGWRRCCWLPSAAEMILPDTPMRGARRFLARRQQPGAAPCFSPSKRPLFCAVLPLVVLSVLSWHAMSDEQRHSVVQRLALTGVHSFQIGGFHSQWGQDRWVAAQLSGLGKDGVYVELGANDGLTHSNSAYFDKVARFRGLCIEPFADNFAALQANRPRCTNVHSGVGASSACTSAPGDGGRTLVAFSPPNTGWTGWLDTYDGGLLAMRETAVGEGNITRSKVPCSTLDTLLTTHGFEHVDYLAVDTEGSELEVLRSLDWERTPPRVVQVEVVRRYVDGVLDLNPESSIEAQLLAEMEGRGYTLARVFTAPWRPPTDVSGVVPKSHDLIFQRRAAAAAAAAAAGGD